MEDIEIRIKTAIDDAESAKSIGDIKASLRELKSLGLEVGDTTSESFQKIQRAIGETNDKVGDMNAAFKSMSGEPIENITNSLKGLKSSLLSLDLKSAKTQFNTLTTSVMDFGKGMLGMGEGANFAKVAMNGLKVAVAATGIGALVLAVGYLVQNFDKLKTSGGLVGKVFVFIGDSIKAVTNWIETLLDKLGIIDKKELDAQSNREEGAKKAEEWMDRNADKYDEFTQRKMKADVDYKKASTELDKDTTKSAAEKEAILKELLDKRTRDINKADSDRKKAIDKANEDEITKNKQKEAKLKEIRDKKDLEIKNENDKRLADNEKLNSAINDQEISLIQDENKRAIAQANLDNIRAIESIRKSKADNAIKKEALLEQERVYANKLDIINKKIIADKKANNAKELSENITDLNSAYTKESIKLLESLKNKEITQKEYKAKSDELEINSLNVKLSLYSKDSDEYLATLKEKLIKEQQMKDDAAQKEKEINDKARNDALAAINQLNSIGQTVGGTAQAILNSFTGITSQVQNLMEKIGEEKASIEDKIMAGLQVVSSFVGGLSEAFQAQTEERLNDIQTEEDAKIASQNKMLENGTITEKQYKDNVKKINDDARKKELDAKKKAFKQEKAIKIVQAAIATAVGVVSALQGGPILGPIMAAVAGALGAAQIAIIAGQKFPEGDAAPSAPSAPSISTPSSGAGDSGAQAPPPSTNFFGLGQNNMLSGGDQKVFVVESDITSAQDKVARIRQRSILGG